MCKQSTCTLKIALVICVWTAKTKHNTSSVCSLLDRYPVLQVFSNLLPWYSSTAQLCLLLLLPFSGAPLALTPRFHTSVADAAHNMGWFKRKKISDVLSDLFTFIISYSPYCHTEKRKAGIYYLIEIRVSSTSLHPLLALPPRGSSVCRYAKPLVMLCAKRQELTQSLVWRLKYLHKEP